MPHPLELLAPARDLATARQAILHGADAVYIGAPSHGARSKAVNSFDDIAALVDFAAPFGVKVYVTVNTIVYDSEIADVEAMIRRLWSIGVDALIVQDMGILEMDIPPIPLHASTQCDTRTPEKALMLERAGMSQIVVARELGLAELREICQGVSVPVEAFVHGALCVSYSGDCRASLLATGRSANRGECAQMCRLPYDLIDGNGRTVQSHRHLLSLRDLCRIDALADMADAGVASFKIEGRMKDIDYVKEVTAAYRQALDALIDAHPDRYCRASRGRCSFNFTPSLTACFNRGYTDYFLRSPRPSAPMSTPLSPKSMGEYAGRVAAVKANVVTLDDLRLQLNNGDGLTYITPEGRPAGFRINRAEGNRLHLNEAVNIPVGTRLHRSFDRLRHDLLSRPTASRLIDIDVTLRITESSRIVLDARVDGIATAISVCAEADVQKAERPDPERHRAAVAKLGDSIYRLREFIDEAPDAFIPASQLTALRRLLVEALDVTLRCTITGTSITGTARRPRRAPKPPTGSANLGKELVSSSRGDSPSYDPPGHTLPGRGLVITHRDNVANRLAAKFYNKLGAVSIEPATELKAPPADEDFVVMTTRFCLRRELGACLKTPAGARLRGPLTLRAIPKSDPSDKSDKSDKSDRSDKSDKSGALTYRLDFDCANCRMQVVRPSAK